MSTHTLAERAMTMNLSIGLWAGYRLDREASRQVTEQNGAHKDAARVNKHLIPKEALAPVVTAANAIRTHFYANTLPWKDNGDRLMTRMRYLTFIQEHEELRRAFDAEVDLFLDHKYPSAVEQAGFRMGELFDRNDYPRASELKRKFYATLEIDPITTAGDFRVQIDQEHVDKVRAAMEAAAEKRVQQAMADVWKRLADVVGRVAERLDGAEADGKLKTFRDATVTTSITELVELIPDLNVLEDPDIEAVRLLVREKLGDLDVKALRKDEDYRSEVADDAKKIMEQMSGYMKAFGAE